MKSVQRALHHVLQIVWFLLEAHYSLPRAINMWNLRKLKRHGYGRFYQYPLAVFLWPIVPAGFYGLLLDHYGLVDPHVLGWIFGLTVLLVLLTVSIDITLHALVTLGAVSAALVLGGALLYNTGVWDVIHTLRRLFAWMDVTFPRGLAVLFTGAVAIAYAIMLFWQRFDKVLEIRGDTLTVRSFGVKSATYQKGGWQFDALVKDVLEFIFGGGTGTLSIVNPANKAVLMSVDNVPGFRKIADAVQNLFAVTDVRDSKGDGFDESSDLVGAHHQ